MFRLVPLWLALVIAGANGPAFAASPARAGCELHIWPTEQFVVTQNLGGANLGLVGALIDDLTRLRSPEGVREQLQTQLSPAEQERVIRAMGLNVVLALPDHQIVIEPANSQPVWTLEQLKSPARLSQDAPVCYAELAIISHQYLKQAVGTLLRTFIRYREFGPDGVQRSKVLDTTATKAEAFPAGNREEIPASTISLQNTFRDNLIKFARDKLKR